jgi:hypothetical protein
VDTRTKIVSAVEAAGIAAAGATVVSGYFDPLIASHAQRLAGLKRDGAPLLVLIATPNDPILPARARAELVASLGIVDHVTELAGGLTAQVCLEPEDNVRLEKLVQHVHSRQRAAS